MKRVLTVCIVLAAAALLAACPAGAAKVKRPGELRYPKLEMEPPSYEQVEFDNGMHGFFIEDHEVPIVNIYMLVTTNRDPADKTGLGDLATWSIRNGGGTNWDADRINDELEFVDARLEMRTGLHSASIMVDCLKKDLPMCLEILGDLLVSPALPDDKIELRRETMLEDIRRENDDPRRLAYREFDKLVYGDHPMGRRPTEATVSAITRDDIAAYQETFFRPNNTIIGISGDVTLDEVTGLLDGALAGWVPAEVMVEPEPPLELTFKPSVNYIYKDVSQGVILIGHLGANSHDPNLPAIQIMDYILGGGSFTSRITQRVRTDEGLAYAAYSEYGDNAFTYGVFTASSQTRADATARAIALIEEIIRDMQENGPTQDELDRAIDTYLNKHVFDYDSKQAVVRELVRLAWEGRPLDTPEREVEAIGKLTVDDVKTVAARYLHPDGLTVLVVGNADEFDQPLSNFGKVNVIELN